MQGSNSNCINQANSCHWLVGGNFWRVVPMLHLLCIVSEGGNRNSSSYNATLPLSANKESHGNKSCNDAWLVCYPPTISSAQAQTAHGQSCLQASVSPQAKMGTACLLYNVDDFQKQTIQACPPSNCCELYKVIGIGLVTADQMRRGKACHQFQPNQNLEMKTYLSRCGVHNQARFPSEGPTEAVAQDFPRLLTRSDHHRKQLLWQMLQSALQALTFQRLQLYESPTVICKAGL